MDQHGDIRAVSHPYYMIQLVMLVSASSRAAAAGLQQQQGCSSRALTAAHSNSATTWPSFTPAARATLERDKDVCAHTVIKELVHTEVPEIVAF